MRREQSFLSATPMLKLETHVPGSGPAAGSLPKAVHGPRAAAIRESVTGTR